MTATTIIICMICWTIGVITGFYIMFQVSKEMVSKVRYQEEQRHRELITHMDQASEHWQDIVIDIQHETELGRMQNKSVKDQLMIIRACIAKDRTEEQEDVENLAPEGDSTAAGQQEA